MSVDIKRGFLMWTNDSIQLVQDAFFASISNVSLLGGVILLFALGYLLQKRYPNNAMGARFSLIAFALFFTNMAQIISQGTVPDVLTQGLAGLVLVVGTVISGIGIILCIKIYDRLSRKPTVPIE